MAEMNVSVDWSSGDALISLSVFNAEPEEIEWLLSMEAQLEFRDELLAAVKEGDATH